MAQPTMTDASLIKKCKKGLPKYQRMLVERYNPILMPVCRRYCRNQDDIKDCLQDGWIRIFKHLDKFDETQPFKNWSQRIMINCAIVQYHKHASIINIESQNRRSGKTDPIVYSTMNVQEILKLLNSLSDIKRIVFVLHIVEGYRHSEIAEMLDITIGTSRSILSRTRLEIQQLLICHDKAIRL